MFLLELAEVLDQEKVTYAVVGGYAVSLHGAVRGTVDIDLVISLTQANYVACEKALQSIGLQPKLPVSAADMFQFRKEYIAERNLRAWSFYDPKDPSRLVDIVITYQRKKIPTKLVVLQRRRIPVLSKPALIKMKTKAGRPQDLEDVRALEQLK